MSLPSDDNNVNLCGKIFPLITKLLLPQNSARYSPFSFMLLLPHLLSWTTFALKSPRMVFSHVLESFLVQPVVHHISQVSPHLLPHLLRVDLYDGCLNRLCVDSCFKHGTDIPEVNFKFGSRS